MLYLLIVLALSLSFNAAGAAGLIVYHGDPRLVSALRAGGAVFAVTLTLAIGVLALLLH